MTAWTVTVKVERAPSGWDSVLENVFPRPHVYFPCASSLCSLPRGVGMGPIFPLQGVKRSPRLPAGDPSGALGTGECTQPTGVEAPQACNSCFTPQVYFSYLKLCSSDAHPGREQPGDSAAHSSLCTWAYLRGRAHLRLRTRAGRGPAGGLPSLRWWRPLRRLARLRERLMKDFIECEDREQRQKAEGGGCSLCSRGGMRKC